MYPSLFISHGAPNSILGESHTKKSLAKFGKTLKKPKYIIVFSAHYVTEELEIIDYDASGLMYDFYGFEQELYDFEYEIASNKELIVDISKRLEKKNIKAKVQHSRKTFDHGVWTALYMLYEKLDIPVIQVSIPYGYSNTELIKLGEAFQVFKDEAIILTSGGLTHNLSGMRQSQDIVPYAKEFNDYVVDIISKGDEKSLLAIENLDTFRQNHPSTEHFLPLFIALGSAKNKKGVSFNSDMIYSNISMECFVFDK